MIARILAAIAVLLLVSCAEEPVPVTEALDWIDSYYGDYPPDGGTIYIRNEQSGKNIHVLVEIPRRMGAGLKSSSYRQRQRAYHVMCPGPLEAVWRMLPDGYGIYLSFWTGDTLWDTVTCRWNS